MISFELNDNNPFLEEIKAARAHERNNQGDLSMNSLDLALSEIEKSDELELLTWKDGDEIIFALNDDDYLDAFGKEYNIDIDVNVDSSDFKKNPCPAGLSLADFRTKLERVNDEVYKRIKREGIGKAVDLEDYKVIYEYALFVGNEPEPFDSSKVSGRCSVINLAKDIIPLPGILDAIASMTYQEEAEFLLSCEVMYGALGVGNRVPPGADIIARLQIIKLFDHEGNEIKPEMSRFEKTIKVAKNGFQSARRAFYAKNFEAAIKCYQRNIELLEGCHLANEDEERNVKSFLVDMHLEMALCFNKTGNPQKTCIAIRDLEKLQPIKGNVKALFAKGKALLMLDDFKAARKCFQAAHKLEPSCRKVIKAIEDLNARAHAKAADTAQRKNLDGVYERELADMKFVIDSKVEKFLNTLNQ